MRLTSPFPERNRCMTNWDKYIVITIMHTQALSAMWWRASETQRIAQLMLLCIWSGELEPGRKYILTNEYSRILRIQVTSPLGSCGELNSRSLPSIHSKPPSRTRLMMPAGEGPVGTCIAIEHIFWILPTCSPYTRQTRWDTINGNQAVPIWLLLVNATIINMARKQPSFDIWHHGPGLADARPLEFELWLLWGTQWILRRQKTP